MSINNSKEATRLANACLPKILEENGEDEKRKGVILSEKNVSIKNICRLWAGMGYIYQVTITLPSSQKNKTYKFIIKHVTPPKPSRSSFADFANKSDRKFCENCNYTFRSLPVLQR